MKEIGKNRQVREVKEDHRREVRLHIKEDKKGLNPKIPICRLLRILQVLSFLFSG